MFDTFRKHLKPVEDTVGIRFWIDKKIRAGDKWHTSIGEALNKADAILMCISASFIWSDYIREHELPIIRQRAVSGAKVIPVIFKDVIWEHLDVAALQAVPKAAKPIQLWRPQSTGHTDATRLIKSALEEAWV